MNGNNEKNIVKTIQSFDGYENKDSIEIIKIIDSKNDRTVAFLYGNQPAYIHFYKNELGNYRFTHIEKHSDEALSIFNVQLGNKLKPDHLLVVTNNDNPVSKMKAQIIGDTIKEKELSLEQKSASLIKFDDMPKPKENGYELKYEYFDKNGKQITEDDLSN